MRKKTEQSAEQPVHSSLLHKKVYRDLRWDRLDNTAHLFPIIAAEGTSNVYRVSVALNEPVEPDLLQRSLEMVLPHFDGFNMRLRRGFFWHYLEENGKSAPEVEEETSFPCRYIHPNQNNSYLFRVTYYRYRINLEVFHALADGMGAINFLKELTYQYLRLRHPELQAGDALSSGTTLNREDSFLKHYRKTSKKIYRTGKAYLIKGERLPKGELGVMHGYLDLPALKTLCHQQSVTINEYLVAVYVWSIYTEYLHGMPSPTPIRIAVPVNLRPYFRSITTKNFFVMVSAEFHPTEEHYTFPQVLEIIRESLRAQLTEEHLEQIFSYNVANQKNRFLRALPLPLKSIGMRYVYTRSALANTATVTNVGRITVAEAYHPYVDTFYAYMPVSTGQHIKGSVCSFGDRLVFTFSYDLIDPSLQRGFFRKLTEDGLHVEIESNGVHYG